MLFSWSVWETAQLCISCKLRTPLGKPLDTFMAFEGAIKGLARETAAAAHKQPVANNNSNASSSVVESLNSDDNKSVVSSSSSSSSSGSGGCNSGYNLRRVRLLIELVEQLEKTMYNAADGTATALVAPTKPVRTFFHTNKSTCAEWLTRIRLAVVVVSLHCGLAASAVRNGHCLLQDLLDSANTQGPEFETAVLYVAWGLSRLHEAEAVQGLYAWCRDTVGSKLPFLKPLVEHAGSRYEQAIDQYKMLLNNEVFDSPAKTSSVTTEEERKPCSANIAHTLKPLVADQLTECYLALQDWNGLQEWKELEAKLLPNQNGNASKRFKFVTTTSAKAMEAFDSGDMAAAEQLLNWSCPQGEGGDTPPSWNCYQLLGDTSHSLMNVAVKMAAGGADFAIDDNYRKHLLHCKSMASACVVESVRNVPSEILNEATLLQFSANALLPDGAAAADGGVASFLSVAEPAHNKRKQLDSGMLAQLAKTARKEGNIGLASRQMYKQLKDVLGLGVEETNGVNNLAKSVLNGLKDMSAMVWTDHKAAVLYEIAKLQYSMGHRDTALQLCTTVAFELAATPTTTTAAAEGAWLRERCARMLLTLAKWQQAAAGSTADDFK
ncbi:hypothetical protein LSTR_LSTR007450 [Laodelphax striatellus]|uniref:Uncharacterized protein n=1 Tax=Laodelphax striatellus TaxID=195883 RepID=A0A482X4C3_LAOST|nr:hypothetical protein LSTR_LSTR007450 [Laodelphax striatellus]